MIAHKRERLFNISLHFFFVSVIGIAALWGIERNTTITILPDEFAYWTSAAWLNGKDWSTAMVNCPYYGYGYGLFLAIVMKIFHDVRIMYQAALVTNAGMLICNYFIAYKCWLMLVGHNKRHGMIGAFLSVIYCSNIFFAKMTFVEVFFSFLFWILIWLSLTMRHSRGKRIGFCLIIMLLLATHNRALGIVVAFALSAIVCWRKEESKREKLELFCILLLGCLLVYIGKKYFQSVIYPDPTSEVIKRTDAAGQLSKIKFLLSWDGFQSFIISFLGKNYYVLISSFLLLGYGCVYVGRKMIVCFSQKNWLDLFPYFFSIVSFLAVLCITAIYFAPSWQYRTDTLLYGRYHECLLGPLILFGVGEILYQSKIGKETACITLVGIVLTLIVVRYIPRNQPFTHLGLTCVGIADLFYKSFSITKTIYTASLRVMAFSVLVHVFKCVSTHKAGLLNCCFVLVAICWINIALFDANTRLYPWTEEIIAFNETLLESVERQDGRLTKLYLYPLDKESYSGPFLQFIRPDAEIIYLEASTELDALEKGTVIFTDNEKNTGNVLLDEQQYELLSSNYYFTAWRKKSD